MRLWIDCTKPSGTLSNLNHQHGFDVFLKNVIELNKLNNVSIEPQDYKRTQTKELNAQQFGFRHGESHCFRGYPLSGSFKQFLDTDSKYLLHLDSDMIFYETEGFSWIKEGIRIMEENNDILCVLPKGGPPTPDIDRYIRVLHLIKLIKKDGSTYLRTSQVAIILFIEKDLKVSSQCKLLGYHGGNLSKAESLGMVNSYAGKLSSKKL